MDMESNRSRTGRTSDIGHSLERGMSCPKCPVSTPVLLDIPDNPDMSAMSEMSANGGGERLTAIPKGRYAEPDRISASKPGRQQTAQEANASGARRCTYAGIEYGRHALKEGKQMANEPKGANLPKELREENWEEDQPLEPVNKEFQDRLTWKEGDLDVWDDKTKSWKKIAAPDRQLGRLERVELRDIWSSEAADFTPWLAHAENLEVLANTLDIQLELEAQEKLIGPFRADILCKDIATDEWVLIENQLERTDHLHLGQLLTYAAGLQAVTIVWVAAKFTEEHRAALDWLNKITDDRIRFFGLQVELWRIGASPAAPRFNIVSKPNNWSQSVKQAARAINDEELSDARIKQREYWTAFNSVLNAKGGPVLGNKKPQAQPWMTYPIGRAAVHLNAVIVSQRNRVRAELYLSGDNAKAFFGLLKTEQEGVEQELGFPLDWQELPDARDSRISISLDAANPKDTNDWNRQHEWLAEKLNALHWVFSGRVKGLDPDDWQPPGSQ
jgi:hypothetical protein